MNNWTNNGARNGISRWQNMPKVELHLHLDCSLSFDVVHELVPVMTEDRYRRELVAPPKCHDLADYLERTRASVALLQTERALRLAVDDLLRQLAADGVIYAEIRFAPLLHLAGELGPSRVVEIVNDQLEQAVAATGVEARLILATLRHFDLAQSIATAVLVNEFRGSRVAALDIAGDEAGFPLAAHRQAFEYVAEQNIPCTAHGGEARGPDSVWEVLETLHPSRIGHGVRSIEDPVLVEHLKAENIHLEVCPTCNVQIDIYNTLADHPVDLLYREGVSVGINTDARATTPTTLTLDYGRLADIFGWTQADFFAVNRNAIRAAFAPDDVRATIERQLVAAYDGG